MENKKNPEEMSAEELVKAMDEDSARIGLVIADLYRTLVTAMKELPDMELHTEFICLSVNDDGISAFAGDRHRCEGHERSGDCYDRDGYERDFTDDEEGMIYDEIN